MVGGKLQSKFCPVLHIYRDEKFKKTLETMSLIDKAVGELEKRDDEENLDDEEV